MYTYIYVYLYIYKCIGIMHIVNIYMAVVNIHIYIPHDDMTSKLPNIYNLYLTITKHM